MTLKKFSRFVVNNYLIVAFLLIVAFVGLVSFYKLFFSKSTYVYAKVELGQGLWWALTAKPSVWFINAIKVGEVEKDLLGKPIAQVLSVRYYPSINQATNQFNNQYNVFLLVKLRVDNSQKTGKYIFKRSTLAVGSSIDLEFQSFQVSGTVIELSKNELKDRLVEKTIELTKKFAYPWEYDAIKIGDSYFDGKNIVFEVLDKQAIDTAAMTSDMYGNINPSINEKRKYITVKARIKVKQTNDQFVFGEDQAVNPGAQIAISTPHYTFDGFIISEVN